MPPTEGIHQGPAGEVEAGGKLSISSIVAGWVKMVAQEEVTEQEESRFLTLVAEGFSRYIDYEVIATKISPESSTFNRNYRLTIFLDKGRGKCWEVDVDFDAKPERIRETLSSGVDSMLIQTFARQTIRELLSQIG